MLMKGIWRFHFLPRPVHQHHKDLTPKYARYATFYSFYITIHSKNCAADPRYKGDFKYEMFLWEKMMMMIEGLRVEQRKTWKEFGMTGWDRRRTGPHAMGGLRGRLQRCLIDTQSQRYCQGPSQSWRNRAQCTPTVSRQIHLFRCKKITGRNTQKDINTHTSVRWGRNVRYSAVMCAIFESKVGEGLIYVSVAGKKS